FESTRVVTLAAGGGTFNVTAGTTLTWTGPVAGAGGLTQAGPGTLVLSNFNAYAGGTTVAAGTLALGRDGTLPLSGAVTVTTGTLDLRGHSQAIGGLTLGPAVAVNPTVADTGGGNLTLGGDVTVVGGSGALGGRIAGALDLGGASRTFSAQGRTDQFYDLILGGPVRGTGGLTLAGGGALALTAANTYAGPTTVTGGDLYAAAANVLPPATAVTLASGTSYLSLNPQVSEGGVVVGSYDQTIGSLA